MLNRLSMLNQRRFNQAADYFQLDKYLSVRTIVLLQRLAIIAGVLLLSTTPLVLSPNRLILLLGLLLGLVVVVFFLYWPSIGILALIPASLIISQTVSTGTETTIHTGILLSVLLIGLWVLDMVSRQRRFCVLPRACAPPVCAPGCPVAHRSPHRPG